MSKHTYKWVIGVFLAASLMVVTGAAIASSSTAPVTWPATCKGIGCVDRHLNQLHNGAVVNSARHAAYNKAFAANTAQHAALLKQMETYDATIAALTTKMDALSKSVAGYDTQIAALKGQIVDLQKINAELKAQIGALESWKASLQKYVSHIDVNVKTGAITTTAPDGAYMVLFEKADAAPPPIFP